MQFYKVIEGLLLSTDKYKDKEGKLIKSLVIDSAFKIDSDLIELLITNEQAKTKFFKEIAGHWVFNINDFILFIQDKNFLDDSYTRFKNKIGLNIDNKFLKQRDEVALVWPFKDCVLEGNQDKEDTKRQEIFFNEVLAQDEIDRLLDPKVLVNWTRHTPNGDEKVRELKRDENGTIKENLLIKGNNLLALHTLKKQFRNKVKLIYIDPPYNTGNDGFKYNDRFNHSTWLTFMKNRLEVAKELLRDDGVIFVQCDDNEQAYLKVLMDEVFGRENFVKTIHVQMSIVQGEKVRAAKQGNIVKNGEYLHIFSKNGNKKIGLEPLYDPSEYDTHYSIYIDKNNNEKAVVEFCLENKEVKHLLELAGLVKRDKLTNNGLARAYNEIPKFREFIHQNADSIVRTHTMIEVDKDKLEKSLLENKTYVYKHNNREYLYGIDSKSKIKQRFRLSDKLKKCDDYYNTFQISNMRGDWWAGFHVDMGNINKESETNLNDGQKPERLLQNIIKFTTTLDDIILDFHAGSGTTGAVAHKMGRQWILVEQMDYIKDLPEARLVKVLEGEQGGISKAVNWQGGGDFIYCELAKYNETFMDLVQSATTTNQLLKIWLEMKEKAFLDYRVETANFETEEFEALSIEEQKTLLVQVLDKNQLYVNYTEMEDETYNISQEDKNLTNKFYNN